MHGLPPMGPTLGLAFQPEQIDDFGTVQVAKVQMLDAIYMYHVCYVK